MMCTQLGEGLGVQGQHTVDTATVPALMETGSAIADLVQRCRRVSNSPLPSTFHPDTVECSFINTRTPGKISTKKTWCGWSFDGDLINSPAREAVRLFNKQTQRWEYRGDPTPKIFLNLGASAVTWGFKYSKKDRDCLAECTVQPGDAIVRWGAARSWCSALVGIGEVSSSPELPFTFVQVKLADHRGLQQAQPGLYRKLHDFSRYLGGSFEVNKWFQYSWKSVDGDQVEITNVNQLVFKGASPTSSSTVANSSTIATLSTEVICNTSPVTLPSPRARRTGKDKPSKTDEKTTTSPVTIPPPPARRTGKGKPSKTDEVMKALAAQLVQHCSDESLIKGWEVCTRFCFSSLSSSRVCSPHPSVSG